MNQSSLKKEKSVEMQDNACYESVQNLNVLNQNESGRSSIKYTISLWILGVAVILLLLLSLCSMALLVRMSTPSSNGMPTVAPDNPERLPKLCNESYLSLYSSLDSGIRTLNSTIIQLLQAVSSDKESLLEFVNESFLLSSLNIESGFNSLNETIIKQQTTVPTPGVRPEFPAPFCATILHFNSSLPSGYYWLQSSNGSAVRVYCDMTTLCGGTRGWRRIAQVDMTQHNEECPSGLELYTTNITRTCRISNSSGSICSSTLFSPGDLPYSSVCGKIRAFQFNTTDAFHSSKTIEEAYIDGVSITYGIPRRHIWSFGSGADQGSQQYSRFSCPCSRYRRQRLPSFVGSDYFCESGIHTYSFPGAVYFSDPLWDGKGCRNGDSCCSLNSPPWFMKRLSNSTSEDLEMRVCRDQDRIDEDILIEQVDLLVW